MIKRTCSQPCIYKQTLTKTELRIVRFCICSTALSKPIKRESLKVKLLTHLIKWKKFTALRCLPDFVLKTS